MIIKSAVTHVLFDVFGTVFDLSSVPKEEVREYARHIRKPEWSPLHLPKSWETLPAHEDAHFGLAALRDKYTVVTCSNGPLGLLVKLSKNNRLTWDGILPLELHKVFKPNPKAYLSVCEVLDVKPENCLFVTANKNFGDLEGSSSVGMQSVLIRGESDIKTITELAAFLEK